MTILNDQARRFALKLTTIGLVVAGVGFAASVADALSAGTPPAAVITLAPSPADSGTSIAMSFPSQQSCPGDATAGFRWHTFITPLANDPATLTFSGSGVAQGPAFTAALRGPVAAITNQLPTLVDGFVTPPNVLFLAASFGAITPGDYWLGIACTDSDNAPPLPTERYWAVPVTITGATGAGPNNFNVAAATTSTTTTTSTTSTSTTSTTSTTVAGTTTTVVGGGVATSTTTTTSAAPGAATSSSSVATSSTVAAAPVAPFASSGGSPTGISYVAPTNTLASTGSSPTAMIVWGVVLLVLGRMTILLSRQPKVLALSDS